MPRNSRLDAAGTLHHVIIRGIEKKPIVSDDVDRANFTSRLGRVATETSTKIFAWALMPNHAHLLVRSSEQGLAKFMRRLLTGYAITYNLRHKRHGHLFQNRYKSIVCDEDTYFTELVRYIHLNPLRAKLVPNMSQLDRYHWSGHSTLMGKADNHWQDVDEVLAHFGTRGKEAREIYRRFVYEGVNRGRRPDLVGGGLIRSLGGWAEVQSIRRNKVRMATDERILGSGSFVDRMLKEADPQTKRLGAADERIKEMENLIEKECKAGGVSVRELKMGSKRGQLSKVRRKLVMRILEEYGLPLSELARNLGVSTSAISKIMDRAR